MVQWIRCSRRTQRCGDSGGSGGGRSVRPCCSQYRLIELLSALDGAIHRPGATKIRLRGWLLLNLPLLVRLLLLLLLLISMVLVGVGAFCEGVYGIR